jgi:hypothetical protein
MTADLWDIATFTSAKFTPVLPEDSQVNPNVYGAELAWWLAMTLVTRGIVTSYPIAEDWGWFIEYTTQDGEFAVHCGNIGDTNDKWQLSLRRFGQKLFGRGKPSLDKATPLVDAIKSALSDDAAISDLNWLYDPRVA